MLNIGVTSYLVGGLLFLTLTVLLATNWRGGMRGTLLAAACTISFLWCMMLAYQAAYFAIPFRAIIAVEIIRGAAWLLFLLVLLDSGRGNPVPARIRYALCGVPPLLFALVVLQPASVVALLPGRALGLQVISLCLLSLMVLVFVEQLYRNISPERRWALKYLCIGIGGMFAYDLVLYANALMFMLIDADLWNARGVVNALVAPLIAVSAARNPNWSLDVFISRRFVFYGTTLVGVGLFMSAAMVSGYYIRYYGGDWGTVAQVVFLFVTFLVLLSVLFSGQARARFKVFLSKHFYSYKYDYRDEWLRFIDTLAEGRTSSDMPQRVIQALAQIVESTAGMLWVRDVASDFHCAGHWNRAPPETTISADEPLPAFLRERNWVIDFSDVIAAPDDYPGLGLPAGWHQPDGAWWLAIPLRHHDELIGFVVLGRPRAPREINWEDRDLLKTAGQQAAGYLALLEASEALSHARQFEAFNRLSTYVVHDLKNMVAQLALLVSNAQRHRHKPEFLEDAIQTIDNAVARMNRLLLQLRKARFESPKIEPVALQRCLAEVIARCAERKPVPALDITAGVHELVVSADPDRLAAVLEHLVQNAQEACREDGCVVVRLDREGESARIMIIDDGVGMDADFIRRRLYHPFDSTKGGAGMGIGVYEAREFVLSLNGRMRVESAPGRGSTFTLLLPLAEGLPAAGEAYARAISGVGKP